MSLNRPLHCLAFLTIFALPLACGVNAAESALPLDVQQRLEVLKTGFESFVLKTVTIPYEEGIKALNAKIKPVLERESAMAAKRKDLDALVRTKADIERADKGLLLTETDAPPPDSLKSVYAAYKLELAKIVAMKKTNLADAKQRYDKGLSQIQDTLTTEQKVEAALHVKNLREILISDEGNKRQVASNTADTGGQKEADKDKVMPSAQQPEIRTNKIEFISRELDSSDYFRGHVYSDLDKALKVAKTTTKPLWVIGYGKDEEKHRRHWQIHWFMDLEETKSLVNENFIQVMAPFSENSIQPLIAKEDNLELSMLFLLSPQGKIIFKRVLNENPEWGLRRTKEYILKTQTDAGKENVKDEKIPTLTPAPKLSDKYVLMVKKGQGGSFFHDELEDIQCIRANQGEPVLEWMFGIGKVGTEIMRCNAILDQRRLIS